jgi:hypothetical protein
MVGRLAGAYCPALLPTDVVDVARSALTGRAGHEMDEVETIARAALDAAVDQPDDHDPLEVLQAVSTTRAPHNLGDDDEYSPDATRGLNDEG